MSFPHFAVRPFCFSAKSLKEGKTKMNRKKLEFFYFMFSELFVLDRFWFYSADRICAGVATP